MYTDELLKTIIEGILFTYGSAISPIEIAKALEVDKERIIDILEELRCTWEEQNRGFQLTVLDGMYQMCTNVDIYEHLIKIAKQPKKAILTDVLLETLSIIAYKQPITKSEIEKIRGVSSDHAVNKLVEYDLVQELGRLDAPGRPMLFGTTEEFLRSFGVSSVEELPSPGQDMIEDLRTEAEAEIKLDV